MTLKFSSLCIVGVIILQAGYNLAASIGNTASVTEYVTESLPTTEKDFETREVHENKGDTDTHTSSNSKSRPVMYLLPSESTDSAESSRLRSPVFVPTFMLLTTRPGGYRNADGNTERNEYYNEESDGEGRTEDKRELSPTDVLSNIATGAAGGAGVGAAVAGAPGAIIGGLAGVLGGVIYDTVDLITGSLG